MTFSFGTPAATATPAASTGFSFGGTPAATPAASTPATASSGFSFGGTPAASSATASTGFSFGASTPSSTGSSLSQASSSVSTTSGTASSGFSFGAKPAGTAAAPATPASSGFSFGATAASTPAATAGPVSFLGSTSTGAAAGTVSAAAGATVTAESITFQTQFSSLPDQVKKSLFDIQVFLQKQQVLSEEITQQTATLPKHIDGLFIEANEKLAVLKEMIKREKIRAEEVNGKVRRQHQIADTQERLLQRLSQPSHLKPPPPTSLPTPYFYDLAYTFDQRMQLYKDQIEEIEQFLSSSAGPASRTAGLHDASILAEVAQNQSDSFLAMSARVAELHESLSTLKNLILQQSTENPYVKTRVVEKKQSVLSLPPATPKKPGAPSTQMFGTTATTGTTGSSFGLGSTTPTSSTGFSFGTPAATTPSTGSTGFSFGSTTPAATTPSTGFSFGSSTPAKPATPTSGFSFGASTPAASTPSTGFSFGGTPAAATPSTSFSFGAK